MSERKRILLLVGIMAFACIFATIAAIGALYNAAIEQQRNVLISIAKDHVRLIESLAGFTDGKDMPISREMENSLLEKISNAHRHFDGMGFTGEFNLAKREGNKIVFLLDHRFKYADSVSIPIDSNLAEPMRLALAGHSGSVEGLDYRGIKVLAAYEWVPNLHWGVVAKLDLAEVRAPFVSAGLLAMALATTVVLLGARIFIRVTNPIIAQLQENALNLGRLVESLQQSEESLLKARNELETRVEDRTASLVNTNKQLEFEVRERTLAEERLRALWSIAQKGNAEVGELCDHVLQNTLHMTRSEYAFYGFLNPDESLMTIYSWSKEALEDCRMVAKPIEHPIESAGIWAEAIRSRHVNVINDYKADGPGKKGTPDGHVQLSRILAVPVFNHDRIVSVVVAANKGTDYDDDDVKQLEAFARGVQSIIDQRKIENALRSSEAECRLLSHQVIDAQEKERKRLAREFHDGIGQSLAALKYRAEGYIRRHKAPTPEGAKELNELIQMIREIMNEVRQIQNDLHPAYLDMMGLLETISDFCNRFQDIYSNIHITLQLDISEQDLPDYLKVPIFRIFQEAMNNAAKHSQAGHILVSMTLTANKLELVVEDNGKGFELREGLAAEGQAKKLGLFSMKERANLSGGSFEIKTAPGQGTTVVASWSIAMPNSE